MSRDFGIARLGTEDTITSDGQVLGTASYLAPERALGEPATDASDRYSLAVVAFESLVGERPFTSQHFAAQARQHVEEEPPAASERNRSLPPAVDAVLARGMAKRPEDRWPSAQDFAQALETALTEAATKPHRVAVAARPARATAAAAAAAAAGAGAATAGAARAGRRPATATQPTTGRRTAPRTGSHPPDRVRTVPAAPGPDPRPGRPDRGGGRGGRDRGHDRQWWTVGATHGERPAAGVCGDAQDRSGAREARRPEAEDIADDRHRHPRRRDHGAADR